MAVTDEQKKVEAFPGIADAVGDQLDALVDGGVYSGLDVVRMLALGAKSVLIGKSWGFGLAAYGQAGVKNVLELIHKEMLVAMALTGCISPADIDSSVLDNSQDIRRDECTLHHGGTHAHAGSSLHFKRSAEQAHSRIILSITEENRDSSHTRLECVHPFRPHRDHSGQVK